MILKLEGFHNTSEDHVEDILRDGFIYKYNDEHWLGQGIYFFSDIDVALDNIDMLKSYDDIKTIAVEINVDESEYLDMDVKENLNSFRRFWTEKSRWLRENGKELVVNESDRRKALLKYKCFFMDCFKAEKGYSVVSKTFPKDSPPYAEKIDNVAYIGLPFLEKYICVKDNEYIVKKNIVEKEWIV